MSNNTFPQGCEELEREVGAPLLHRVRAPPKGIPYMFGSATLEMPDVTRQDEQLARRPAVIYEWARLLGYSIHISRILFSEKLFIRGR